MREVALRYRVYMRCKKRNGNFDSIMAMAEWLYIKFVCFLNCILRHSTLYKS